MHSLEMFRGGIQRIKWAGFHDRVTAQPYGCPVVVVNPERRGLTQWPYSVGGGVFSREKGSLKATTDPGSSANRLTWNKWKADGGVNVTNVGGDVIQMLVGLLVVVEGLRIDTRLSRAVAAGAVFMRIRGICGVLPLVTRDSDF